MNEANERGGNMDLLERLRKEQARNGGQKLALRQWAAVYEAITGTSCNYETLRKRRAMARAGTLVPPRVYILSAEEFLKVLDTPLPLCVKGMLSLKGAASAPESAVV